MMRSRIDKPHLSGRSGNSPRRPHGLVLITLAVLTAFVASPSIRGWAAGEARVINHHLLALPTAGHSSSVAVSPSSARLAPVHSARLNRHAGHLKTAGYLHANGGSPATVLFLNQDTTTSGAWQGAYGGDGFDVFEDADANNPIDGFTVSSAGPPSVGAPYVTENYTTGLPANTAGLQTTWFSPATLTGTNAYLLQTTVPSSTKGTLGVLYSSGSTANTSQLDFEENFTDGNEHEVALYFYDDGAIGRAETVNLYDKANDPGLTTPLDSETLSAPMSPNGTYLSWNVSGDIMFQITTNVNHNAVVNGVFFGGPANVSTATVPGGSGTPNSGNGTVNTTNPSGPGGLPTGASAAGSHSVVLTWTADSADTSFNIYKGTTSGGETLLVNTVGATRTNPVTGTPGADVTGPYTYTYTDTNVTYGQAYYYQVTGSNSQPSSSPRDPNGNTAPPSDEVGPITPEPLPPAAPTTVTATTAYDSIVVTWSSVSNATAYNVYRGTSSGGEVLTSPINGSPITSGTTYTDLGLTTAGVTYYYEVESVNLAGTSAPSAPTAGEGHALPTLAVATHGADDTTTGGAWKGVYGGDGYDMVVDPSATAIWNSPATPSYVTNTTSTATGVAITGLPSGANGLVSWASTSSAASSLQNANYGTTNRSIGAWFNTTTFTFPLTMANYTTPHKVALYVEDFGSAGRAETVTVTDANSGATLATDSASAFGNGKYLIFTITGPVNVKFTQTAGSNAVLSGIFFGGTADPAVPTAPGTTAGAVGAPTATAGNGQVVLAWGGGYGATSFNVYRGTTSGGESATPVNSAPITALTFTDTTVADGTAYYYTVTGVDAAGTSAASGEAGPVTPQIVAPTGLTAATGTNQIVLTWNLEANATGYNVYRSTTSGAEIPGTPINSSPVAQPGSGTTVTYTDTTAVPGTAYYYEVTALNGTESGPSNQAGPVQDNQATATQSADDTTTGGAWKGVYGGDGWDINGDPSGNNPYTPSYAASKPTLSGASSVLWSASAVGNTTPGALQVSAPGSTAKVLGVWYSATTFTIDVNLTDAPNTHEIALYLNDFNHTGRTETLSVIDPVSGNTLIAAKQENPLQAGKYAVYNVSGHVRFVVTASAAPNGVVSAVFFGGASNASAAVAPTALTATAGHQQIALSWTAGANDTSYNIYRGLTSGGEGTIPGTPYATNVTGTTFTDTGLTDGTTYYYEVTGVNSNTTTPESGPSNEAFATAEYTAVAPTTLTATVVAGNPQVVLSWGAAFEAASYNIYRGTTAGGEGTIPGTPYASVTAPTTNYTDTAVTNGQIYYYKVTSVVPTPFTGASGESAASNEASATPSLQAPTALAATTPASATVSLTWTAPTGAGIVGPLTYNVYRGTSAGNENLTHPVATGLTTTNYSDGTVTNGTPYFYKVAAANAGGAGTLSNEASATPTASSATLVTVDKGVGANGNGNWIGRYGSEGWDVFQATVDNPVLPAYLVNSGTFGSFAPAVTWASGASATLANGSLQLPSNPAAYIAGVQYSATGFTVPVNIGSGTKQVAFYILDWNATGRSETIQVQDAATNAVEVAPATYTGFSKGWYVVLNIRGSVNVIFTNTGGTGHPNAVLSGIFFGGATSTVTPPAPTGLAATAGNQQVSLSWNPTPGATTYNVYRALATGGEGSTPYQTGVTATSFTDTGLLNGTEYFYTVTAVDSTGESAQSAEVNATPTLPAPASLTASETDGTPQVVLSWNTVANATSYNVLRGLTTGSETSYTVVSGGSNSAYTDTSVTNGTAYFYEVQAVDQNAFTSGDSNEATTTPKLDAATLTATPAPTQITLTWPAVTGATSYNIYENTSATGTFNEQSQAAVAGTNTVQYTGLTNGTGYYFYIIAVNAGGPGTQSSTIGPIKPEAAQVSFSGTDTTSSGNWIGKYGADGYDLFQATDVVNLPSYATETPAGSQITWGTGAGQQALGGLQQPGAPTTYVAGARYSTTTYTFGVSVSGSTQVPVEVYVLDYNSAGRAETVVVKDATSGDVLNTQTATSFGKGVYYKYMISGSVNFVFTKTAGNNCVASAIFYGLANPSVPPAQVTGVTATPGNEKVALSWNNPSPTPTTYNVYRSLTSGGEGSTPYMSGITTNSFTDTGLTNGTAYYYTVAGVDNVLVAGVLTPETGPQSAEVNATPVLPAPTGLIASTAAVDAVALSWTAVNNATAYNVYRGTSSGHETLLPASPVSVTSFTDTTATADTQYFYYVTALSPESVPSNEVSATPVTAEASLQSPSTDTTTSGNWQGVYGLNAGTTGGYNIFQDTETGNPKYPTYLTGLGSAGKTFITWAGPAAGLPTYDLETVAYPTDSKRIAGVWYSTSSFSVDLSFNNGPSLGNPGTPNPVEFYLLDFNNAGRAETISVTDAAGTPLLAPVAASGFGNGVYYKFNFNGNVKVTFTKTAGNNAVLSGIFFH